MSFQRIRIDDALLPAVVEMFDELGEPVQVLTPDSDRPLVVHHIMGQVTLIAGGTGYVLMDDAEFAVGPGDLLVLSPRCRHSFYCPEGELTLRHWHWPQRELHTDRTILRDVAPFTAGSPAGEVDAR
ncbi:AraC family ligand binding domain-containing protein [Nocardia terpenica]|nr:AraC family ligand binding domain-containing protein [Nocardia terpenica]MBF6064435.1 AraC family ligand binding domain-containing protein [Nocardia terpenica]MBF6106941.1 AraC family ligand binding domain-containing protein [Nocardia terpenica]MBF6114403.1 AraC family ligand binding domain-containing protein [Nocardia terpenica]MBF6121511.1 AraC family ligand binding domain-containing protein [Nocardia terpenica]MBF6153926.1 AraC family ligand binding domain-containing protein [Nocardia te